MPIRRRAVLSIAALIAVVLAGPFAAAAAQDRPLTVFAAASLRNALDAVNAAYETQGGPKVTVSYAASPALARQIEAGAPADVFISADLNWMNHLKERGHIAPGDFVLLGNRLVLIAPKDSRVSLAIGDGFPLAVALGDGRLAIADVMSVPAGRYAKAALASLGVWASVEGRLAQAENVRAALKLVAAGEAPLGVVYATDARAESSVKVVGLIPEATHPPVAYPAAMIASAADPALAQRYLGFLRSPAASTIFAAHGFTVPTPTH
jgi:molybdate transport system substrate-binding protein